jgi:hypothetical protein
MSSKAKFATISIYRTFFVSVELAYIMPLTEVFPRCIQLPSKQAVMCDGSSSLSSATASLYHGGLN